MSRLAILYTKGRYFVTHSPKIREKRVDDFSSLKLILDEYEKNQPDVFREDPQLIDLLADEEKYVMGLRARVLKKDVSKI